MSKQEMIDELEKLSKEETILIKRLEKTEKEFKIKIRKQMDNIISTQERIVYLTREIENK